MSDLQRRGIVLAGGAGTRLYPLTRAVSKQLMPVYDKPLVYYAIGTLMLAKIRDILLITTREDADQFARVLGDGSQWGIAISYAVQDEPRGIAQALTIAEPFLGGNPSALVLGDNMFHGFGLGSLLARANERSDGATIFGYPVSDPRRYGVVGFDEEGRATTLEEKPEKPKSRFAVTGLYFYDATAPARAAALKPSPRGEFEITDLNRSYLEDGMLHTELMGRGLAWLDTGTHEALLDASTYVRIIEERQGLKICCPEEIAWRQGFIDADALRALAEPLRNSGYGDYLLALLDQEGEA